MLTKYDEYGNIVEDPEQMDVAVSPVQASEAPVKSTMSQYDDRGYLIEDGVSTAPVYNPEKDFPKENGGGGGGNMFTDAMDWIGETAALTGDQAAATSEGLWAGLSEWSGVDKNLSNYQKKRAKTDALKARETARDLSKAQQVTAGAIQTIPLIAASALTRSPAVVGATVGAFEKIGSIWSEQAADDKKLDIKKAFEAGGMDLAMEFVLNVVPGANSAKLARQVVDDAIMGVTDVATQAYGESRDASLEEYGTGALVGPIVGQTIRKTADLVPKITSKIKQIPDTVKTVSPREIATNIQAKATDAGRKAYETTAKFLDMGGKKDAPSDLRDDMRAFTDVNASHDATIREANEELSDPNINPNRRRELNEDIDNASVAKVANDIQYAPAKAAIELLKDANDGIITQDMLNVPIKNADGSDGLLSDYFKGVTKKSMEEAKIKINTASPGAIKKGKISRATVRFPQAEHLDVELSKVDNVFNSIKTKLSMKIRDLEDARNRGEDVPDSIIKTMKTLRTDSADLHNKAGEEAKQAGGGDESMRILAERLEINTQRLGAYVDGLLTGVDGNRINWYSEASKFPMAKKMKHAAGVDAVKIRDRADEITDARRSLVQSPGTYMSAGAIPAVRAVGKGLGRLQATAVVKEGNKLRDQLAAASQVETNFKQGDIESAATNSEAGMNAEGIQTVPMPDQGVVPKIDVPPPVSVVEPEIEVMPPTVEAPTVRGTLTPDTTTPVADAPVVETPEPVAPTPLTPDTIIPEPPTPEVDVEAMEVAEAKAREREVKESVSVAVREANAQSDAKARKTKASDLVKKPEVKGDPETSPVAAVQPTTIQRKQVNKANSDVTEAYAKRISKDTTPEEVVAIEKEREVADTKLEEVVTKVKEDVATRKTKASEMVKKPGVFSKGSVAESKKPKEEPKVEKTPETPKAKKSPVMAKKPIAPKADEPSPEVKAEKVETTEKAPESPSKAPKVKSGPVPSTAPKKAVESPTEAPRAKLSPLDVARERARAADAEIEATREKLKDDRAKAVTAKREAAKKEAEDDLDEVITTTVETPEAKATRIEAEKVEKVKVEHRKTDAQIKLAISKNDQYSPEIMEDAWNDALTKGVNPAELTSKDVVKVFGAANKIITDKLKVATAATKKTSSDKKHDELISAKDSDRVQRAKDAKEKLETYSKEQTQTRQENEDRAKAATKKAEAKAAARAEEVTKNAKIKAAGVIAAAKVKAKASKDTAKATKINADAKVEAANIAAKAKVDTAKIKEDATNQRIKDAEVANAKAEADAREVADAQESADIEFRQSQQDWAEALPETYGFIRGDFTNDLNHAISQMTLVKNRPLTMDQEGAIVAKVEDMIHKEWKRLDTLKSEADIAAAAAKRSKSKDKASAVDKFLANITTQLTELNTGIHKMTKAQAKRAEDAANNDTISKKESEELANLVANKVKSDQDLAELEATNLQREEYEVYLKNDMNLKPEEVSTLSDEKFSGRSKPYATMDSLYKGARKDHKEYVVTENKSASAGTIQAVRALESKIDNYMNDESKTHQNKVDYIQSQVNKYSKKIKRDKLEDVRQTDALLRVTKKKADELARVEGITDAQSRDLLSHGRVLGYLGEISVRKADYPDHPELWISTDMKSGILEALGKNEGSSSYEGHYQLLRETAFGDISPETMKKNVKYDYEQIKGYMDKLDKGEEIDTKTAPIEDRFEDMLNRVLSKVMGNGIVVTSPKTKTGPKDEPIISDDEANFIQTVVRDEPSTDSNTISNDDALKLIQEERAKRDTERAEADTDAFLAKVEALQSKKKPKRTTDKPKTEAPAPLSTKKEGSVEVKVYGSGLFNKGRGKAIKAKIDTGEGITAADRDFVTRQGDEDDIKFMENNSKAVGVAPSTTKKLLGRRDTAKMGAMERAIGQTDGDDLQVKADGVTTLLEASGIGTNLKSGKKGRSSTESVKEYADRVVNSAKTDDGKLLSKRLLGMKLNKADTTKADALINEHVTKTLDDFSSRQDRDLAIAASSLSDIKTKKSKAETKAKAKAKPKTTKPKAVLAETSTPAKKSEETAPEEATLREGALSEIDEVEVDTSGSDVSSDMSDVGDSGFSEVGAEKYEGLTTQEAEAAAIAKEEKGAKSKQTSDGSETTLNSSNWKSSRDLKMDDVSGDRTEYQFAQLVDLGDYGTVSGMAKSGDIWVLIDPRGSMISGDGGNFSASKSSQLKKKLFEMVTGSPK